MKILKGMKDIRDKKYQYFINIATEVAEKYDFNFIKTPILEETNLFIKSAGNSSDIVNKEMYTFVDKNNKEITMRPEGTAGVVRNYIESGYDKQNKKEKYFYYGSMFRYEKPQKGRFREFNQFGCESFGEESIYEDISILLMIKEILNKLNINFKLKINYLGCEDCNITYKNKLKLYFEKNKENLCNDCNVRLERNPLRIFDCKIDNEKEIFKKAPILKDNICNTCKTKLQEIEYLLKIYNIEYKIDNTLVRGLDYYNGLIFEFTSDNLGAQNAICGGGRYDNLIEKTFNGKSTPAIGFGLGIERIIDLIEEYQNEKDSYYIGGLTEESIKTVFEIGQKIRKDYKTYIEYKPKKFQKQIEQAEKLGYTKFILIGETEINGSEIRIRDIKSKTESIKLKNDF